MNKRIRVPEETRIRLFTWCSRHCCFCGKECATSIEIHHIDSNHSNNDEDNLIPVCFDCHAHLGHYNAEHPKGNRYRPEEIKARREQIYDRFTQPYVRHVDIQIHRRLRDGTPRQGGDTSCTVRLVSTDLPVRMRLSISFYESGKLLDVDLGPLYSGDSLWNLNPGTRIDGHFELPVKWDLEPFEYRAELRWSIIDILEREHQLLPVSFVWSNPQQDWWFDPMVIHSEEG